jgi:hypothetical protein
MWASGRGAEAAVPYLLVAAAALLQLVPDGWNVTPIGAVGLFAGARCRGRIAWAVPLAALLLSDVLLGFYAPLVMAFVYLGYLAGPIVGRALLAGRRAAAPIAGGVVLSATLFFLVSNLGNWLAYFPHTATGLIDCYLRGLPSFGMSLLGETAYAALFFGVEALALRRKTRDTPASLPGRLEVDG